MTEQEVTPLKQRTIMIPVDASKQCEDVLDWYVENVRQAGDKLLIYHCHELPHPSFILGITEQEWKEINDNIEAETRALEAKYIKKCEALTGVSKIKVENGVPGEKICRCIEEESVDFIIMGTRGLGTIRRTIMGSTSDHVLHHSHKPVFVVPKCKIKSNGIV